MTDDNEGSTDSPLAQEITRDGHTVHIHIYEDGSGGWILEAVDEHGNSTLWDDPFATAQAALDEAVHTIDTEGINTLIGAPGAG